MPKGKKFNAVEKYFLKKEEAYRKQIKELSERVDKTIQLGGKLIEENDALKAQVAQLTAERDELLKLNSLDPDELKRHMQYTQSAAAAYELISSRMRY